jgi:hypothetical protein
VGPDGRVGWMGYSLGYPLTVGLSTLDEGFLCLFLFARLEDWLGSLMRVFSVYFIVVFLNWNM